MEAGIVEECADSDDICLTDELETSWLRNLRSFRAESPTPSELATLLGMDSNTIEVEEHEDAFIAYEKEVHLAQWESQAAYVTDMAAVSPLRTRIDGWEELGPVYQSRVLYGLRAMLPSCPSCGGTITAGERRVDSCCRSFEVIATQCADCGVRLFEVEVPGR